MTSPKERLYVAPPKRKTRASDLVIRHLTGTTLVCSPVVFTTSRLTSIQLGSYLTFVSVLLRKEVIQPHLPVRLPCYDFTPITDPTLDSSLQKGWATGFGCYRLSWCDGRCVQGPGTYSPRRC